MYILTCVCRRTIICHIMQVHTHYMTIYLCSHAYLIMQIMLRACVSVCSLSKACVLGAPSIVITLRYYKPNNA